MNSVITRVYALLALCLLSLSSLAAQGPPTFADQIVGATVQYDQASTTPVTGSVFYAKLVDSQRGIYSYTRITETSVNLKPTFAVQTQTETGFCFYVRQFGAFSVSGCGTGGLATAGGNAGASGTGTVLVTKDLGRGWLVGISGGPSYSAVTDKVTYPVGLVVAWGAK